MIRKYFAFAALSALFASGVGATPLIIDGANNASVGGDCTFACLQRYQQAYDSSLFSGTVQISAVDFRYSNSGQSWTAGNQYIMTIGIANGGVNALVLPQAGNFASSQTFNLGSFTGSTTSGGWYGFTGSYTYDSSLGDLIIDIQRIAGNVSSISTDYNYNSGGEFSRTYSGDGWGLPGYIGNNYGNVTRFDLSPANNVPEPSTLALAGLALAGLALRRRRSR